MTCTLIMNWDRKKAELDLSRLSAGIYLVYVENKRGDRVFYKLLKR